MGGKMGENPAALRAAVFSLSLKNLREAFKRPPPAGRGGYLRGKPQYARPDPTQPNPTRTRDAFEKLISLERVDRFTSGLLCSMSAFNKFHIYIAF